LPANQQNGWTSSDGGDMPPLGIKFLNDRIYLGNGDKGIPVYNVATPTSATFLGSFGNTFGLNVIAIQPYVQNGRTYVFYGDGPGGDGELTFVDEYLSGIFYLGFHHSESRTGLSEASTGSIRNTECRSVAKGRVKQIPTEFTSPQIVGGGGHLRSTSASFLRTTTVGAYTSTSAGTPVTFVTGSNGSLASTELSSGSHTLETFTITAVDITPGTYYTIAGANVSGQNSFTRETWVSDETQSQDDDDTLPATWGEDSTTASRDLMFWMEVNYTVGDGGEGVVSPAAISTVKSIVKPMVG
jgi:hypothetical protein